MENFINDFLNDMNGGCAGGLVFIAMLIISALWVVAKAGLENFFYTYIAPKVLPVIEQHKAQRKIKKENIILAKADKITTRREHIQANEQWNRIANQYYR